VTECRRFVRRLHLIPDGLVAIWIRKVDRHEGSQHSKAENPRPRVAKERRGFTRRRQGRRQREIAGSGEHGWVPRDPVLRAGMAAFLILAVSFTVVFSYFYIKYDRIIERRFRSPVFSNSARIYALPRTVRDGEKIEGKEIAAELRRAGYSISEIVSGNSSASRRKARVLAQQTQAKVAGLEGRFGGGRVTVSGQIGFGTAFPAKRLSASFTARRAATMALLVVDSAPSESVLAKNTRSIGCRAKGCTLV